VNAHNTKGSHAVFGHVLVWYSCCHIQLKSYETNKTNTCIPRTCTYKCSQSKLNKCTTSPLIIW